VAASRRGLAGREAAIELPGGELTIAWRRQDGHVLMTGPVAMAFTGEVELDDYPA
jgi:diaminopimelate epimerase